MSLALDRLLSARLFALYDQAQGRLGRQLASYAERDELQAREFERIANALIPTAQSTAAALTVGYLELAAAESDVELGAIDEWEHELPEGRYLRPFTFFWMQLGLGVLFADALSGSHRVLEKLVRDDVWVPWYDLPARAKSVRWWRWRTQGSASCHACRSLDMQVFEQSPERPHPGCTCMQEPIFER